MTGWASSARSGILHDYKSKLSMCQWVYRHIRLVTYMTLLSISDLKHCGALRLLLSPCCQVLCARGSISTIILQNRNIVTLTLLLDDKNRYEGSTSLDNSDFYLIIYISIFYFVLVSLILKLGSSWHNKWFSDLSSDISLSPLHDMSQAFSLNIFYSVVNKNVF